MKIGAVDLLRVPHVSVWNMESGRTKSFTGVSTDSRTVKSGEIFFALRGEKYDGHKFIDRAFAEGAACAVIDDQAESERWKSRPILVVRDTTRAFGLLANIWRMKFDIPILAVGGSNGKTTTKEMIAAVLSSKYRVLKTEGNLNNQVGVPQTLLRLNSRHEIGVVEIGTNHAGEIAYLSEILAPTHGMITNIGHEHLEFFGDIDGVANAEAELFSAIAKSGTGFINTDDEHIIRHAKKIKKKMTYGFTKYSNTVRGTFHTMTQNGCAEFSVRLKGRKPFEVHLSVPGKHAMSNALAAATAGLAFKVPQKNIQEALGKFHAIGKRMEVLNIGGVTILNDTYNANPDSVISALETLSAMKCRGKKIVILADMLEMGGAAREEHARIGDIISTQKIDYLFTFGEFARSIHSRAKVNMKVHYDQKNILSEFVFELLAPGDAVLVKGSRGMKMEDVVTFLTQRLRKDAQ